LLLVLFVCEFSIINVSIIGAGSGVISTNPADLKIFSVIKLADVTILPVLKLTSTFI